MSASWPGRLGRLCCCLLTFAAWAMLTAPAGQVSAGTAPRPSPLTARDSAIVGLAPRPAGHDAVPGADGTPGPPSTMPRATSGADGTPGPQAPMPGATPMPVKIPAFMEQTENILILGTDQRGDGQAWRTDTIMVVVVDHTNGERVGIISIPRDLWVEIPGYGMGRINQADYLGEVRKHPGGGPALTGKLIQENLGIPTQHWVRLKYDGLPRLVDTLGGVTVHLDCPLYERTPHPSIPGRYVDWSLPSGDVTLDGATAKKFATYRYLTNDSGRARRQQQLIWAIRERGLQLDMVPKIPELWQALSDVFSTDLSLLDIVRLAGVGAKLQPEELRGLVLGMEVMGNYITPSGAWVLLVRDRSKLESELANLFAGPPLVELAHNQAPTGRCPPPPRNFTSLGPTPTPSPTATAP
jgi:polyisoprenyl-teichoic acid--peptidoglycan teichoic acid transferase